MFTTRRLFSSIKFTKTHEWVKILDNSKVVIGITKEAREALGDIVFVELPEKSQEIQKNEVVGAIESVKAVSDIHSPLSGTVIKTNRTLENDYDLINESAEDKGWLYEMKYGDKSEIDDLLDDKLVVD